MHPLMQSKQKKNKKQSATGSKGNDGIVAVPNYLVRMPKSIRLVPDRFYTKLSYDGIAQLTVPTGAIATSLRFQPSAAYDVDPSLGSTAVPGFVEFAAFYDNYRVTVSDINVETLSLDNRTTLSCVLLPLNVDPGSSPTGVVIQSWVGNAYAKYKMCAATGGPPTSISHGMTTEKIFGSKMIYFDDNFQSLTTTVPNNNWYWAIGFIIPISLGSAYTFTTKVNINIGVEFFSRKRLQN
jgi:hypothetical protein